MATTEELVRLTLAGSFDRARAPRSKLHVNGRHGRCLGIQRPSRNGYEHGRSWATRIQRPVTPDRTPDARVP